MRCCMKVGLLIIWAVLNSFTFSSHYAETGNVARVLSTVVALGGRQNEPSATKKAKQSSPRATDVLEKTLSFRGWIGENAVVRREELLKDGGMRTSFFLVKPKKSWIRLRIKAKSENEHDDPPGLLEGRALISDYVKKSEDPAITFQFDADPKQIQALQESINDRGQAKPVSEVRGTLKLSMKSQKRDSVILWKQTRAITPTVGESGMVYKPPELRSAILSPKESTLLVELIVNEKSEYIVISMRPFRRH